MIDQLVIPPLINRIRTHINTHININITLCSELNKKTELDKYYVR